MRKRFFLLGPTSMGRATLGVVPPPHSKILYARLHGTDAGPSLSCTSYWKMLVGISGMSLTLTDGPFLSSAASLWLRSLPSH